jgi:hypothetical protein
VTSKLKPVAGNLPENVNFAVDARYMQWASSGEIQASFLECDPWVRETINPIVLGKVAHQVCVEVENWREA